jgi:hypothetical protein
MDWSSDFYHLDVLEFGLVGWVSSISCSVGIGSIYLIICSINYFYRFFDVCKAGWVIVLKKEDG